MDKIANTQRFLEKHGDFERMLQGTVETPMMREEYIAHLQRVAAEMSPWSGEGINYHDLDYEMIADAVLGKEEADGSS